jgi:hypothetical protein
MFVVINFITVMWYNPNLDTDCPPWVYASCAIGLFLYQTFDAVDGMQAYVYTPRLVGFADLVQTEDEAERTSWRTL